MGAVAGKHEASTHDAMRPPGQQKKLDEKVEKKAMMYFLGGNWKTAPVGGEKQG